jgi:hypothetical protein
MSHWIRVVLVIVAVVASATAAAAFDWNAFADEDVVVVLTKDEDGSARETKVWLAVLDGQAYIRTGGSTWGGNITREPQIVLRIGGGDGYSDIRASVDFVKDPALRERVEEAFRKKYGAQDALVGLFRGSDPKIMRLVAGG